MVDRIIPCLPDDVALCILSRLPRSLQTRRRLICHSWKDAMEPARINSVRKTLNISEVWPVFVNITRPPVYGYVEVFFTIVDPFQHCCYHIPLPSQLLQHRCHFYLSVMGAIGSKVFIAAGSSNSVRNESIELMQGVYIFDALCMKWQHSLYASLPTTVTQGGHETDAIAVDMDGGYLYVVGGFSWHGGGDIQGAERLDIKMRRWEVLPDPHVKRVMAVGVVMKGLFYMMGGCSMEIPGDPDTYVLENSGEIWDPTTRQWSLVPDLWPGDVFDDGPKSRVVALGDRLYALRQVSATDRMAAEELMYYDSASKTWMSLGLVPLDISDDIHGYDVHLLKMGEELWVSIFTTWVCVATKPTLSQPLCWRTLPHTFKGGICEYDSIMVGELHV